MRRAIWWSQGGGVSYERGTPVSPKLLISELKPVSPTPETLHPSSFGLRGYLGFLGVGAWEDTGVIQNQPRDRLRVPASGARRVLRRCLKLSPTESHIFKTFSREFCPSDGRSRHIAADVRRPCEGDRRC